MQSTTNANSRTSAWLKLLPWAAAMVCLLAIVPIRISAHTSDFAMANVLTILLLAVGGLMMVLGLALSRFPRFVWKVAFLAPILILAGFFAAYKFERVDGELVPRFEYRWGLAEALPDAISTRGIPREWLEPRDTDFPQFLGPERNAMLPSVALDPDWEKTPPKIAWKQSIGDGWSSFAVQGDVAITMEQRDGQEWVSAYNVLDGALLWKYAIDARHFNVMGGTGPRCTPTISNNRVFASSAVSRFVCLEISSGQEIWSHDLLQLVGTTQNEFESEVAWGRSASPLVVAEQVVIPLGGVGSKVQTLIAFHRDSGTELWRAGDDQISYSSPALVVLDGMPQILLTSEQQVAAYAVESGTKLWSVPWPGSSSGNASVSQPVVVDASRVLLSKGYGDGAKLLQIGQEDDRWTVQTLWTNPAVLRTKFTSCVVSQGYAFGLSDGILECVDLATGKRQWKKGRYRQGQLLLVGEHLLITSESGDLVLVPATHREFNEVAKMHVISDVSWNTAALSGNRLLMRNSDEVACVILPIRGRSGEP